SLPLHVLPWDGALDPLVAGSQPTHAALVAGEQPCDRGGGASAVADRAAEHLHASQSDSRCQSARCAVCAGALPPATVAARDWYRDSVGGGDSDRIFAVCVYRLVSVRSPYPPPPRCPADGGPRDARWRLQRA